MQSPLFPALQLTLLQQNSGDDQFVPQLPEKPLTQTSSIQVYVIPAEKTLFVQGFEPHEYAERPPIILRGCLFLRVLKPLKIKSISLTFKGQCRTDWPEGIPPKKNTYVEINDIVSHTWPFYQQENPVANGGASIFRPLKHHDDDVSHLSLADSATRKQSPMPGSASGPTDGFFARNLSPATFMRRAALPGPGSGSNLNDSFQDLTTALTAPDMDSSKPGHFPLGDYIYNFEHVLHPLVPELTEVTFGSTHYYLETDIVRVGTFKLNLTGRLPVNIVRTPSETSVEENEPIVITRDWEDQLRYDIVVGGKAVVLDTYLPIAFRFVPLYGKVALHRVRVYLTENLEYFCQHKKVHRMEPPKKFLLLEHKAKKGKSLLLKKGGLTETEPNLEDDEVLPRELEFQLYVPKVLSDKHGHRIHPDTSYDDIQAHHWIKICLRISKLDPENPEKRKHYEISIDLPIHILLDLAAHGNTLLPAYDTHPFEEPYLPVYTPTLPPLSPGVIPVEGNMPSLLGNIHSMLSSSLAPAAAGASIGIARVDSPMPRSDLPAEFCHIHSTTNNDDPIERDNDLHLDANIYQPSENVDALLHSPQAKPHPGTFSPPAMNPVLSPSLCPPPFDSDVVPANLNEPPPPAYEAGENAPLIPVTAVVTPPTPVEEPTRDLLARQFAATSLAGGAGSAGSSGDNMIPQEQDVASDDAPIRPPSLSPLAAPLRAASRRSLVSDRSSISSLSSSIDQPVELTMPLLGASSTSLDATAAASAANLAGKSRSSSVHSLLQDSSRRPSNIQGLTTSIMDIVDGDLADFRIQGNLSSIRNPRIKKHYQDEPKDEQKGGDSSRSSTSYESEVTIDNNNNNKSDESQSRSTDRVPGFKMGYVMD